MRCALPSRVFCAALFTAALAGCATSPLSTGTPFGIAAVAGEDSGVRSSIAWQQANAAASDECLKQAMAYEELTQTSRSQASFLGSVAIIAASIVSPAVAAREGIGKATAAAAGGLAGATGGIVAARDKAGLSPVALSAAFNTFREDLVTQTDFLTKPAGSLDDEIGKLSALKIWCAANAPNPAAAEMKFLQDNQKIMLENQRTQQKLLEKYDALTTKLLR